VAERVRVCDITNDEGNRLLRIVRRSSGSVVTWRRARPQRRLSPSSGSRLTNFKESTCGAMPEHRAGTRPGTRQSRTLTDP
jgi:hypothetical protein